MCVCVYQGLKQPGTSGPILSRQRNSRPMPPLRGNEHDFQTSKKGILGWPQERAQEPTTLVRHLFLPTPVNLLQTLSPFRRSGWPQLHCTLICPFMRAGYTAWRTNPMRWNRSRAEQVLASFGTFGASKDPGHVLRREHCIILSLIRRLSRGCIATPHYIKHHM